MVISPLQINLAWSDVIGETGYKIERKIGSTGTYTQIATTNANEINYSDSTVTFSNTYYYRVRAYNGAGDGNYSPEAAYVGLRPLSEEPPPTQTLGLTITAGYRFSTDVNGYIIGLGRYIGSGTGNTTVILWNDTGTELGRVTVSDSSDWQWARLSTPIYVMAGQSYRVSVSCTTVIWLTYSFIMPTSRVNITISASCLSNSGIDVFPADAVYDNMMLGWADIEFVAE
jgi:hypothetical protein